MVHNVSSTCSGDTLTMTLVCLKQAQKEKKKTKKTQK